MAYWDEIVNFVAQMSTQYGTDRALDFARRAFLAQLREHTNRNTIIYAMNDEALMVNDVSISFSDVHGMMAVMANLQGTNLDIILHSSGGSGEASKAIIDYLRLKFENIRVIVPTMAMSAATMLACGANEIVMGKHSFLGPIDPQLRIRTPMGFRMVAAQDILSQFQMARHDLANGGPIEAWDKMLISYQPDLLALCRSAQDLSVDIVRTLLKTYMFDGEGDGEAKADSIADWLANHQNFLSHGRYISRPELVEKGLKVVDLEEDDRLQDLVLSVFHVVTLMFNCVPVGKIIENHNGLAYLRTANSPFPIPAVVPATDSEDSNQSEEQIDQNQITPTEEGGVSPPSPSP